MNHQYVNIEGMNHELILYKYIYIYVRYNVYYYYIYMSLL
jgi:hypothetical protein